MHRRPVSKKAAKFTAAATIGAVVFVGGSAHAGAAEGCGADALTFDGVRLLNNGTDHTAGPFSIELEPGIYDITMNSWDAHDEHYQPEQENEQWYFTLDSGYTSAPSVDIPTEQNSSSTTLLAQQIDASTSVTVHHLRAAGVNSVEPVCLGFASVADQTNGDVPEQTEPTVIEGETPVSVPDPVDTEVKGIVEVADPSAQLVPPMSKTNPPAAVESAHVSQAPAPQLAITGPSASVLGALVGSFLVMLGTVCTWVSAATRRRKVIA